MNTKTGENPFKPKKGEGDGTATTQKREIKKNMGKFTTHGGEKRGWGFGPA